MLKKGIKTIIFENKELNVSYIEKEGRGELVVLLHGLGGNYSYLTPIMEMDGLSGYAQVAIDMIEYGESSKPQDFSYTMMDQALVLKTFLEDSPYDRIHLVLHSMAGAMGLYLAEMIKNKIASITNMEGNLIASDCGIGSKGFSQMTFEEFMGVHENIINDPDNEMGVFIAKADPKGLYLSAVDLVRCSETGELLEIFNTIDVNKMYIHGVWDRNDELLPLLSEDIKIVEAPDTGHMLHANNLEGFYQELDQFIGSNR